MESVARCDSAGSTRPSSADEFHMCSEVGKLPPVYENEEMSYRPSIVPHLDLSVLKGYSSKTSSELLDWAKGKLRVSSSCVLASATNLLSPLVQLIEDDSARSITLDSHDNTIVLEEGVEPPVQCSLSLFGGVLQWRR